MERARRAALDGKERLSSCLLRREETLAGERLRATDDLAAAIA